jgi:pimeloyl-ACP methyl ester carboxylesterase
VSSAHVAGFSGGSIIAQELALRHPELVRSLVLQSTWSVPDPYLRSWGLFVRWLVEVAPSERAFLEGFFLDIYTARAHNDGTSTSSSRRGRLRLAADVRALAPELDAQRLGKRLSRVKSGARHTARERYPNGPTRRH